MPAPRHVPLFPLGRDSTRYRRIATGGVALRRQGTGAILEIRPRVLARLAEEAFRDAAFRFRPGHLRQLAAVARDPAASENDRFVARLLLENAVIAARGVLPACQDTGTATVIAQKGEDVRTGADDERWLSRGIRRAYLRNPLRASQLAPRGMLEEENTGDNLPGHVEIQSVRGREYRFLFVAKGGGSANKTALYQESKERLGGEERLLSFLEEKIRAVGTAACPPVHLAVVIGGLSPDQTLRTVKLAAAGALDTLIDRPGGGAHAYRDREWEQRILERTRAFGFGAQFGGRHFALDARVIRMPRHAGSLPVGIGVSCNAHRNLRGKITARGVFLEILEPRPERFLAAAGSPPAAPGVPIDLDRPIGRIAAELAKLPLGTRLSLTGPLIVARDAAHLRLRRRLDRGAPVPDYFRRHVIFYAGPARTPRGLPSGSLGPTSAQRMDAHAAAFLRKGASRIMLGKGNRSPAFAAACRRYGGVYLGAVGGAAAWAAQECIEASEAIDFADLGMEAVRRIRVRNLPAFLLGDARGRTLFDGPGGAVAPGRPPRRR